MPTQRETSIRRGIETFLAVASEEAVTKGGLSVTAIAQLLGREKSQVSRTLTALAEYGLVDRDPDTSAYRPGWRIYAIANMSGEHRLIDLAEPMLVVLVEKFTERAFLSVLQGTDTMTILSRQSPRSVQAVGWVGHTTPAYCTSVGKALLFDHSRSDLGRLFEHKAFQRLAPNTARSVVELSRMINSARLQGFATADEEMEVGLVAAAAPVRNARGRIVAALNISGPKYRLAPHLSKVGTALAMAAKDLTDALGGTA